MSKRMIVAFAAGLAAWSAFAANGALCAQELGAQQRAAIDKIAQDAMNAQGVPGISLAVARGSTILYTRGYGYRDIAAKAPMQGDTIYAIGSNTKQFTAAAVMLLARDGMIDIDAPVKRYLPPAPHGDTITIRELLTQTSGLPEYTDRPGLSITSSIDYRPAQLLEFIHGLPLDFAPGTRWEYSNTNYLVLGMLIEAISGMPYQSFVQRRIIGPLGMHSTSFPPTTPSGPSFANGYSRSSGVLYPTPQSNMSWAYAAGALVSNTTDLVKWDDAFLNGRVVDAAVVKEMTSSAKLSDGSTTGYGFGWVISSLYGAREVWHNGGLPGFSTRNATFPDQGLEIVVLGNTVTFDATPVVRGVFGVLEPGVVADTAPPTAAPNEDPAITARVKEWFVRLQKDDLDRAQLTTEMSAALTDDKAAQLASQLAAAGAPTSFVFLGKTTRDIYAVYQYQVACPSDQLVFTFVLDPAGKIAGMFVKPAQ